MTWLVCEQASMNSNHSSSLKFRIDWDTEVEVSDMKIKKPSFFDDKAVGRNVI